MGVPAFIRTNHISGVAPSHKSLSDPKPFQASIITSLYRLKVRIERICMVTPAAIKIKMILNKRMSTTKRAENSIVIHNKEMDESFTFNGTPFFSR